MGDFSGAEAYLGQSQYFLLLLRDSSGAIELTYWLITLVTAFLSKGLLVGVQKPPMPGHKVTCKMDCSRLLNVNHNEVVELNERKSRSY